MARFNRSRSASNSAMIVAVSIIVGVFSLVLI
jgi:hypothetical protein